MARLRLLALALSVLVPVLLVAGSTDRPALAVGSQIRTFVASTGSDANPCSRTSPCRTFTAALAQTAAGGEVVALDTGGYGTLSISQSVTITAAPGAQAFIAPSSGSAVFVNAGASDTVILRNLSLNSAGANYGVYYQAAGALHIENLNISGFAIGGIYAYVFADSGLYVADVVVRNGANGIQLYAASGTLDATILRTRVEGNTYGLLAQDNVRATVKDTAVLGSGINGFHVGSVAGPVEVNLEGCVASGNGAYGIRAGSTSSSATVRVSNCTVTTNTTGVLALTNGSILSRGNNTVEGNNTNGSFSALYTAK